MYACTEENAADPPRVRAQHACLHAPPATRGEPDAYRLSRLARQREAGFGLVFDARRLAASLLVMLEFPRLDQAGRWYNSSEYKPLIAMREKAARTLLIIAEAT